MSAAWWMESQTVSTWAHNFSGQRIIVYCRDGGDVSQGRGAAILALVGVVNLPIIKFSVEWWNTLHQPASIIRSGGSAIDPTILWPLLIMALAFTLLFFTLHLAAMRNEILRRRVRSMQMMQAAHDPEKWAPVFGKDHAQ